MGLERVHGGFGYSEGNKEDKDVDKVATSIWNPM
jgi:hypothetical protein